MRSAPFALAVKRALDFLLGAMGLLVLLPVFVAVALAVRLDSPGPSLFRQKRLGLRGREFTILKFRTMQVGAPVYRVVEGQEDPRVTRLGRFLRRSSLDEIPQLINVLRGDMSLVGPRPDLPRRLAEYSPRQRRRLDMRPGITGLSQVSGRNALEWATRLEFDARYVETWSLQADLRILLRTFGVLFDRRGVDYKA